MHLCLLHYDTCTSLCKDNMACCSSLLRLMILPVAFAVLVIASVAHGAVVEHTFNVSVHVYIYCFIILRFRHLAQVDT